jgi:Spy/CpxP family protein refolding chaperone
LFARVWRSGRRQFFWKHAQLNERRGVFTATMKTKFTLLSLATAGLLTTSSNILAEDPVPPTPPVNPPAAAPATAPAAKPERGPGGPGGQRGDRLAMMKETLGLTPEQVEKIKPLLEKDREKLTALREDTTTSREQKGEKMREILKSSMEEIKPILTPEQLEKWKAEMEKRRAEREKNKPQ